MDPSLAKQIDLFGSGSCALRNELLPLGKAEHVISAHRSCPVPPSERKIWEVPMLSAEKKEYATALRERCLKDDVLAMEELTVFYCEEHPEEINDGIAPLILAYGEKAAAMGRQKACLSLGAIYFDGQHTAQDHEKAVQLFKKARLGEDARLAAIANARLGDCYRLGLGTKLDYGKAFDCYLALQPPGVPL